MHLRRVASGKLVFAFVLVLVTGCPEPADLENVPPCDRCVKPAGGGGGSGGGTSGGSGGGGTVSCETACIDKIFTGDQCSVCHGAPSAQSQPLGALDLSKGYTARLRGVKAKHLDAADMPFAAGTCPTDDELIDLDTPGESWLLKKVNGQQGACGMRMPVRPLMATELTCVETYVNCVAGM